jgi:pSer/pThr/pTyr-binding forkhead associated (FHA) protein
MEMEVETKPFESSDDDEIPVRASAGTATFEPSAMLRIEIQGVEPIEINPVPEIIFGRHDRVSGTTPEVDLTPYAGYRMGVSRAHAKVRAEAGKLYLLDMGSSNGTFLNGQRLAPNQPYILHDGDEVRLGQMVMRMFFI